MTLTTDSAASERMPTDPVSTYAVNLKTRMPIPATTETTAARTWGARNARTNDDSCMSESSLAQDLDFELRTVHCQFALRGRGGGGDSNGGAPWWPVDLHR